jgi:hypothetical protein
MKAEYNVLWMTIKGLQQLKQRVEAVAAAVDLLV